MRWILMVVLALVALGLIVAAVGAALPTAHVASVSARVDATPEQVWRTITDVARFPEWRSDVSRVELESGDAEPRSISAAGDAVWLSVGTPGFDG